MSALPSTLVSFDQKRKFTLGREVRLSRLPQSISLPLKCCCKYSNIRHFPLTGHNYEMCSFMTKIFDPDRIQSLV